MNDATLFDIPVRDMLHPRRLNNEQYVHNSNKINYNSLYSPYQSLSWIHCLIRSEDPAAVYITFITSFFFFFFY